MHVICMKMYLSLFSKFAKSFNLSSSFSFPIWSKLVTSSIGWRCCPNIFPKQPKPSFYSLQFYSRDLRPILILSKRSLAIFFIQKIHNIRIRWNFYHHQAFFIIFVYFLVYVFFIFSKYGMIYMYFKGWRLTDSLLMADMSKVYIMRRGWTLCLDGIGLAISRSQVGQVRSPGHGYRTVDGRPVDGQPPILNWGGLLWLKSDRSTSLDWSKWKGQKGKWSF